MMRFHGAAILLGCLFAAVYTAEGVLSRNYNQDEFQVATGYLKDRDTTLFSRDLIWSQPEAVRNFHVPVRALMRVSDGLTFGSVREPIDLFLLWLPVCVFLFFIGNYILCHQFTRDGLASLLAACAFMLARRVIWDWWGAGPVFTTVSARGLVLSLLPLGLWSYLRWRDHIPSLACFFLVWGIISNLHPLSGWGFVELLGVTILWCGRFRWNAWCEVAVMTIATLAGSLPFILIWSKVVHVPPELLADPEVIREFWAGFQGLRIPSWEFIWQFLQDIAIVSALSLCGYAFWEQRIWRGSGDGLRPLYVLPCVTLALVVGVMLAGSALQASGVAVPIMVSEHSRHLKFIYLTLPVWMAIAISTWFRLWALASPLVRYGAPLALLVLSMAINFPGHKLARTILAQLDLAPVATIEAHLERERLDRQDLEVAMWARHHTPPDAVFYFDSYEFRYYARRSLVFCWFDGASVGFRPTRDLEEWLHRRDRLMPIKRAMASEAALAAARLYQADFAVIPGDWKPPREKPVWENGKYRVYALMASRDPAPRPGAP